MTGYKERFKLEKAFEIMQKNGMNEREEIMSDYITMIILNQVIEV